MFYLSLFCVIFITFVLFFEKTMPKLCRKANFKTYYFLIDFLFLFTSITIATQINTRIAITISNNNHLDLIKSNNRLFINPSGVNNDLPMLLNPNKDGTTPSILKLHTL